MFCRSLSLTLLATALAANAQSSQPASLQLHDPAAILNSAAQVNGLHGDDLQPWHIHGTWQLLDQNQVANQGAFEEWWASGQRFKIAVSANGLQQTRYITAQGPLYTGSPTPPDNIVGLIEDATFLPVPPARPADLKVSPFSAEGLSLQCVSRPAPKAVDERVGRLASAYSACFDGDPPALRMEGGVGIQAMLNSLVRFQGRYVARDVRLIQPQGQEIAIHLDVIQPLTPAPDSLFAAPPDAQPLPRIIQLPESVLRSTFIRGHVPEYPIYARMNAMVGTVVLDALIGKDGSIGNLSLLTGPPLLSQAAVQAVKTWRYRPYILNGEPVEVETQIHIHFTYEHASYKVTEQ
jgi:TonB family protein